MSSTISADDSSAELQRELLPVLSPQHRALDSPSLLKIQYQSLLMDDLPEEMLNLIVTELSASKDGNRAQDAAALLSLSLVSRRFHRLAEPHLYAHVRINMRTESPLRLKRTLEARPGLTKYVYRLSTKPLEADLDKEYSGGPDVYPYKIAAFTNLVGMLPHLRRLEASQRYAPSVLAKIIRKRHTGPGEEQKSLPFDPFLLKRVDLDAYSYELRELIPILRLPNIETLALFNLGLHEDTTLSPSHHMRWNFTNPAVKDLTISISEAKDSDPIFQCFANVFVSLETLRLHESERKEVFGPRMFRYIITVFANAFRTSLRHFEMLDCGTYEVDDENNLDYNLFDEYWDATAILARSNLGSMKIDLALLSTTAYTDVYFLEAKFGGFELPASLIELYLRDVGRREGVLRYSWFHKYPVGQKIRNTCPGLEKFTMACFRQGDEVSGAELQDYLKEQFEPFGVESRLIVRNLKSIGSPNLLENWPEPKKTESSCDLGLFISRAQLSNHQGVLDGKKGGFRE
ncbi:hypothetical protein BCR34DRAFT_607986 [Clohesyomyces aquaticus]|uniref:F-box domain-containing protein n=1 Tax=Clohesyomyces aquaticus TaxID=1231657 RepID=A0A1Y1YBL5_9PLEO|nr:hypothetical protein BCR34DRAFT_607986 [Clohesyomyces aquaticus]